MKISLCNEVLAEMDFAAQCAFAAALGYDGLEVAPYTLGDEPHLMPAAMRAEIRRLAEDAGIVITGLHWLLITPKGLSITDPDAAVRARTIDVMERLVDLCADLGGTVLVHGSPKQRSLPQGGEAEAREWAMQAFRAAGHAAQAAGVTYCIEPLSRHETNFLNTVAEAVDVVDAIASPGLRTMIDTSAAGLTEDKPVPDLITQWLPSGRIAHLQLNDTNRRAPGQGEDDFAAIMAAIRNQGYDGVAAIEPFTYEPDGPTTAARAMGYLHGILEGLT
jgi:D-psicose/D-tagatose/L-ribulose 3-epimerase